jgi:hypothetical protein
VSYRLVVVATLSLPTAGNGGTTVRGVGVGVIVGVVVSSSVHAGSMATRDSSIAKVKISIKIFFMCFKPPDYL